MIEMDQTEYAQSAVTDEVLHLVRLFNDHSVGDKLLYRGNAPRLNFSKSSTPWQLMDSHGPQR